MYRPESVAELWSVSSIPNRTREQIPRWTGKFSA